MESEKIRAEDLQRKYFPHLFASPSPSAAIAAPSPVASWRENPLFSPGTAASSMSLSTATAVPVASYTETRETVAITAQVLPQVTVTSPVRERDCERTPAQPDRAPSVNVSRVSELRSESERETERQRDAQSLYNALSPSLSARLPAPRALPASLSLPLSAVREETAQRAHREIGTFLREKERERQMCDRASLCESVVSGDEAAREPTDTPTDASRVVWSRCELLLAVLLSLSLLLFHALFSLEDLLRCDYRALGVSLSLAALDALSQCALRGARGAADTLREIDPLRAAWIALAVTLLTLVFDRDPRRTDRAVRRNVKKLRNFYALACNQMEWVGTRVYSTVNGWVVWWRCVPRLWLFCVVAVPLSFAVKYAVTRVAQWMQPYVVYTIRLSLWATPYVSMLCVLCVLCVLMLRWRRARVKRKTEIARLCERVVTCLKSESVLVASEELYERVERELQDECERDAQSEWRGVAVRGVWSAVLTQLKRERDIQVNDLCLQGVTRTYWGYKPNRPVMPKR